jgi:hypothetical protein
VYVLVRSDVLPPINQGVQACHAVVELMSRHSCQGTTATANIIALWARRHKTLVLLAADQGQMLRVMDRCDRRGLKYASFLEPDLGDMRTAIAFEPVTKAQAKDLFYGLRRAR